jgi:hypothetical protein
MDQPQALSFLVWPSSSCRNPCIYLYGTPPKIIHHYICGWWFKLFLKWGKAYRNGQFSQLEIWINIQWCRSLCRCANHRNQKIEVENLLWNMLHLHIIAKFGLVEAYIVITLVVFNVLCINVSHENDDVKKTFHRRGSKKSYV